MISIMITIPKFLLLRYKLRFAPYPLTWRDVNIQWRLWKPQMSKWYQSISNELFISIFFFYQNLVKNSKKFTLINKLFIIYLFWLLSKFILKFDSQISWTIEYFIITISFPAFLTSSFFSPVYFLPLSWFLICGKSKRRVLLSRVFILSHSLHPPDLYFHCLVSFGSVTSSLAFGTSRWMVFVLFHHWRFQISN